MVISNNKKYRNHYYDILSEDYFGYANEAYIQPYITTTKPHAEHEPAKAELKDARLLQDYFINNVFLRESTEPKLFCILGDTGTGKTAALVHLFIDYINAHTERDLPYQIRLVSLSRNHPFQEIEKIEQKDKCILLLDALDENSEAKDPSKYAQFMHKIEGYCDAFARVVITCRPQFFHDEQSEPGPIRVRWNGKWLEFKKIYLAPFNDNQVHQFLDKKITFRFNDKLRQKAEDIVKKLPLIAIRPLVLTFIEDIARSDREVNNTLDVFDIIIEKWINRDVENISPEDIDKRTNQWWDTLSTVASYMYSRQSLNISFQELKDLVNNSNLTEEDKPHFTQRAMLARSGNEYHFSHKSFYEYFMAYRFFLHFKEIGNLYSMDFALQIYGDLFSAWKEKRRLRFADIQNLNTYQVAASLLTIGNRLQDLHHFSEAENKYHTALTLFKILDKESPNKYIDDVATTLNNLAILHSDINRHDDAEREYQEALAIHRQLAEKNPDTYLPDVAETLNNLAVLHRVTNRHDDAEKEYQEALDIRRQLAKKNPDTYLPDVAMTLNNLAVLHSDTNRHDDAESEYQEALDIRRQLAQKNPDTYLRNVADTLNNLANLHSDTNRHDEAEREYQEALDIRRQLAQKNPDAFLSDVAMTLNNLAILHSDINRHDYAEKEYQEALDIRRQLTKKNPDAFLPNVATTVNNLAALHRVINRYDDAESEYQEALDIRRQLAQKNPDAFLPNVAMTLNNLAILHSDINRHDDAEKEYQEALDIRRQLAEKNPDAFLPDVAMTLFNIALLHLDQENYEAAEEAAQESLEKFQIMAAKSPAAFDKDVEDCNNLIATIHEGKEKLDATQLKQD